MDDLHFSQLTHELDIAKHFALGHVFGVLLDDAKLNKKLLTNRLGGKEA